MSFFSRITKDGEYGFKNPKEQLQNVHFPSIQVKKLKLDKVLKGHALCVNRLSWNAEGSMLVSGSDDRRVLLWKYPDVDALPMALRTMHTCNIFAVHFLPCTNNSVVVSGGMDNTVQMHRLDADPENASKYPSKTRDNHDSSDPSAESVEVRPNTEVFSCHQSSVKAMAVEPMNPNNFWSASEDGTVREFDTRCPTIDGESASNILVSLKTDTGAVAEVKGIDINQVRPHQMALASSDPYIRIYDRRKLSLGWPSATSADPVLKLAPPQFASTRQKGFGRSVFTTHVSFSSMGDKVVGNYHADHAYSFDVTGEGVVSQAFKHHQTNSPDQLWRPSQNIPEKEQMTDIAWKPSMECENSINHSSAAVRHIAAANAFMDLHQFTRAVECYSAAIDCSPYSWDLYIERAKALLARDFAGDSCFALRDCEQAIILNGKSDEARFFQIKSLLAMNELEIANRLRIRFVLDFPAAASSELFQEVARDIHKQIHSPNRNEQLENKAQESPSISPPLSNTVRLWDETTGARRLLSRFLGHCNMETDIKEAVFLGQTDDLVACGSDEGKVFIYEAATGKIVQVIDGAEHVANCVQAHPSRTTLATSGLGSFINIWGPSGEPHEIGEEVMELVSHNQHQIKCGPSEFSFAISEAQMQFILSSHELVEFFLGH